METVIQDYFNDLCCPIVPALNLKIASGTFFEAGINDQASFETYTGTTVSDFTITDTNIQCQVLTTTGGVLNLAGLNINDVIDLSIPGITEIILNSNALSKFTPNTLPTTVTSIVLTNNQFDNAGYVLTEAWATGLHSVSSGSIDFNANINTIAGTNLETILASKGWTVVG